MQAQAATHAATDLRTVSPVGPTGAVKAGYKVVKHVGHGTCQAGSYQTGTAYRCSAPAAGAGVLDPCWPITAPAKSMACQAKPWLHKVVEVHVSGSAAGGPGLHDVSLPWGMRLGSGAHCLHDVGSVRQLNGRALIFHCTKHRDVFGPLRDSGTHWTAHVYRSGVHTSSGYRSLGWQHVSIAWKGASAVTPTPSPTPPLL